MFNLVMIGRFIFSSIDISNNLHLGYLEVMTMKHAKLVYFGILMIPAILLIVTVVLYAQPSPIGVFVGVDGSSYYSHWEYELELLRTCFILASLGLIICITFCYFLIIFGKNEDTREEIEGRFDLLDSLNLPVMCLNNLLEFLDYIELGKKRVDKLDIEILHFLKKSYLNAIEYDGIHYAFIYSCDHDELVKLSKEIDDFIKLKKNKYRKNWLSLSNDFRSSHLKQLYKIVDKLELVKNRIKIEIFNREAAKLIESQMEDTLDDIMCF